MVVGGPTIFISYRRGHEASLALVTELEAALVRGGFQVLRDVAIEPGERWSAELWRWLMECSGAVAVVSDEAAESDWCRREWSVLAARRVQAGLRVIPLRLEPVGPKANILDDLQGVAAGPRAIETVVDRLQGLRAAPSRPADYLAAHRAWLGWQYAGVPAMGREPFSLADVYIETECGAMSWGELSSDRTIDPFSEDHGGRVDMVETVLGYLGDPEFRELVVVQGPAGSGKSAFSLRLANRLADEGLVPVLVRFRDLRLTSYDDVDELLQDAVRVAPVGEHPPAPSEPLFAATQLTETVRFHDAEICRTVVILDGWDEVALTGSMRLKHQIEQWLPRLRQRFTDRPGPPLRLLLTGRPSVIVDRSGLLRRQTPVLTIRPLRPEQLRAYATRISNRLTGDDWTLDLDRCQEAFASYEAWFTGSTGTGPDVLGSPLLALLAFRTVADWQGRPGDVFARSTALYNALIEITVAHAGKAEEGPEGTVHRGGRTLRRLLQRVASIITTQGGESVSFEELQRRLEDDDALTDWAEQATSESTLHELVVNFYFKSHQELGCEFLHKSFREYLFAEAVVAALEVASEGRSGAHPPPPREWGQDFEAGSPHHVASRSLAGLLSPQWLAPDVRTHLSWLVEKAASADPERWVWVRDLLNDIYGWWGEGAHLRIHPERRRGREAWQLPAVVEVIEDELPRDGRPWLFSPSNAMFDAHLGDALVYVTAYLHVLLGDRDMAGRRDCQVGQPKAVRFRPFNNEARNLIARLGSARHRPHGTGLVHAYLRAVDLSGEDLHGCDLAQADLQDANLRQVNATGLLAERSDLSGADLRGANLDCAVLPRARLAAADLREARLAHAHLAYASLLGAWLEGANLRQTRLCRADLRGADLEQAILVDADLRGADLRDAELGGADLSGIRYDGETRWPAGFDPAV